MKSAFDDYSKRYEHVSMRREDNVIELALHSDGRSLVWGAAPHTELGYCFADVGSDPENHVVILTGTGAAFLADVDTSWATPQNPDKWDKIFAHGRRLLLNLLEIEAPVIAAINGPASVHSEIAVLNDICLAADTAYFSDEAHFRYGVVPGDGVYAVWSSLLGPNRARSFLLREERIHAAEALRLGVVSEVLDSGEVLEKAWEIARELRGKPHKALRYTRLAFTQPLKKLLLDNLNFGLALEGLAGYEHWPSQKL
jgi:enoyl-CoA hydratase/carnithine racemase